MRAIAQFTIHSLNDVVTSATAPTNPYLGQLWVNTSYSPPRTYVWNGSAWKEQNGTDSMRDDISTLTTRASELKTSLDGLTSTVSVITQEVDNNTGKITTLSSKVSTLEQTAESIEARVEDNEGAISSLTVSLNSLTSRVSTAEGNISTLTQRADSIEAEVDGKVDEAYGSSSSSFGWSLKTTGFYVYSNKATVVKITSSGLEVTGDITAKSGSLENMTIAGYLYFGGNKSYYISANNNNSNYYIYLPGFNVNNTTATFSGKLSAPSGTIGGFTITTSAIYKTKTSYNDSNQGVYLGTSGIGLGAGSFYVTSAGKLYASNAEISGTITATAGTIGGFTISATSLSNANGGSSIVITSGSYKTTFSANSVSASYGSGDSFRGWSLGLNQFTLTGYTSSKYTGIKILTNYKKRTSSTSFSNTTVAEGCITSARDTYYNADSGTTTITATPFIIGIPRQYADSPYQPVYQWGAYARFVSYQSCELVYDSAYSGKWYLRNVSGSSYDLTDLIPHVKNHKFYFWKRTASVSNDSRVSITKTTHGLSTVTGAIVIPREKSINGESSGLGGDNNLINKRANYGIYISGTTVYVVVDSNGLPHGFNCIVYGY
jgi:hypothetical protein|uniref:Trimeric coiled-coil viral fiber n=1 Tax=Siphoviridae sp. ctFSL3 TaxID=2825404 RepID=A0A8S5PCN2_9CAUD|nr:MAG TPA: trimeric coiled-coil viral fiber [Siphoviridae sp. ctFSL3]